KAEASLPWDFRPISVSSVLLRCLHRVLAKRITNTIEISEKQTAFRPLDGCFLNIHLVDQALRYHRRKNKSMYMASIDLSKAYDTVTHETIHDTLHQYGFPAPMISYIMGVYEHSSTRIATTQWEPEPIHPATGVKQGDPLSPALFNLVIDRFITKLPGYIGAHIGDYRINAAAFADDVVLFAATKTGLQRLLDIATTSLEGMGLKVNPAKCHTVAITNIPKEKKTAIDTKTRFRSGQSILPAVARNDEWKYLGIPFSPEGRGVFPALRTITEKCQKIDKAPLKPQQRMFALRNYILPSLLHGLALGETHLSLLRKIDNTTRKFVRKWLHLPPDSTSAYIHADHKDGGLHPSTARSKCSTRLTDQGQKITTPSDISKRWASKLHESVDGAPLKLSNKVPQQHKWVTEPTTFLSGADYVNLCKIRINALPSRSRCSRGRPAKDRFCGGGCNAVETTNHILQVCHRTHGQRINRHNCISKHLAKNLTTKGLSVLEEPRLQGPNGINKPDIIASTADTAHVIDVQITNDQYCLARAHRNKAAKYKAITDNIKTLTDRPNTPSMVVVDLILETTEPSEHLPDPCQPSTARNR
ncbi:hypothetical protein CBL_20907, partial [Carabus blaptoides fortunei]